MQHRIPYIERTRALYARQEPYRWVVHDPGLEPPPWAPIRRPLEELRIALIGSGGIHRDDQEPFHFRNDTSYREIPLETPPARLRVSHFGYDVRDAARDAGCVFPLRALRELAADGVVGGVVSPALSFMGGIYSARSVRAALRAAVAMQEPGEMLELSFRWEGDPGWEARAYTPEHASTGPDGKPNRDRVAG